MCHHRGGAARRCPALVRIGEQGISFPHQLPPISTSPFRAKLATWIAGVCMDGRATVGCKGNGRGGVGRRHEWGLREESRLLLMQPVVLAFTVNVQHFGLPLTVDIPKDGTSMGGNGDWARLTVEDVQGLV